MGAVLIAIGVTSWLASMLIPHLPQLMVELNFELFGDLQRVRPGTMLLVAFSVMLLPCIFMGIAFPLAGRVRARLRSGTGGPVGDTLGLNTLGSIAGSLLAGFVLIPRLGLQDGMLFAGALDVAWGILVLGAVLASRAVRARTLALAAAGVAAAGVFAVPRWFHRGASTSSGPSRARRSGATSRPAERSTSPPRCATTACSTSPRASPRRSRWWNGTAIARSW